MSFWQHFWRSAIIYTVLYVIALPKDWTLIPFSLLLGIVCGLAVYQWDAVHLAPRRHAARLLEWSIREAERAGQRLLAEEREG